MSNRERNLYLLAALVWLILLGTACTVAALRHHPEVSDDGAGPVGCADTPPRPHRLTPSGAHAIIAACPLNRHAPFPLTPSWTI